MRLLGVLLTLGLSFAANASMPTWRGVEIRHLGQSASQPETVYAFGNGILFRSDDRGQTWNPLRLPKPIDYADVHVDPNDAQHVLVLAPGKDAKEKPSLQESFDRGLTWVQRAPLKFSEPDGSIGGSFFPTRLTVSSDRRTGQWWAYDGRWFRSADVGQTWTREDEGRLAVNAVQGQSLSYSLDDTVLWRSDSGRSWEKVHEFSDSIKPGQRVRMPSNLLTLSDDELVVRNNQGNWLQSNDRGVSWAPATNGFQNLNQQPSAADTAGPSRAFGGETWCDVRRSPAVAATLLARCVWDNGAHPSSTCFHVSTDSGRSWMPPRAAGSMPSPDCQPPGLQRGWTSTALLLDAADPMRMLAAWQAGGLYRSEDGGQTWQTSDTGLMFRNTPASQIDWMAMGEPQLIQAVLFRDRSLLKRTLSSGVDINAQGAYLGGVLEADIAAREQESREQRPLTALMWPELRRAGATSVASPSPGKGLLTRAFELKLGTVVDDLIPLGYDWGVRTSFVSPPEVPEGELRALLRQGERFGLTTSEVGRLITAYIKVARFPSADQTTLDLLDSGHPGLAVKVLKASSHSKPFDRQSTAHGTPRLSIGAALLRAGRKAAARQIFATIPSTAVLANTQSADEFIDSIGTDCDLHEGAWYRAQGVPLKLSWHYEHCLSDAKYPASARDRVLRAMDKDGGIPPESWSLWSEQEDKRWVMQTALYRRTLRDEQNRAMGVVGLRLDYDQKGECFLVDSTIKGLPADINGMRPGDVLTAVNGYSTRLQSVEQVVHRIVGRPGTRVRLDVLREGQPMTFRLKRQSRPLQAD